MRWLWLAALSKNKVFYSYVNTNVTSYIHGYSYIIVGVHESEAKLRRSVNNKDILLTYAASF